MALFYFFTALLLVILFIVLYQYFFVRKDLIVLKAESEAEKKVLLGRIDGFVSENAIRKEKRGAKKEDRIFVENEHGE